MTNKEFYTAVINANISAEVTEKATSLLTTAENKNSKRTKEQEANRTANVELAKAIAKAMKPNTTYGASEIVTLMADTEKLSTAKITAVAKVAIEDGILTSVSGYKVGGKGRSVKGYRVTEEYLAEIAEDETEDETENDTADETEE